MGSAYRMLFPEVCVIASAQTAEHYASAALELSAMLESEPESCSTALLSGGLCCILVTGAG